MQFKIGQGIVYSQIVRNQTFFLDKASLEAV